MHKKITFILIVLTIGIRIFLARSYAHGDLIAQLTWGKEADKMGSLSGFYEWDLVGNSFFPNHPPLVTALYYWLYPLHSSIMWGLSSLGNFIALNRLAPTKFMWLYDFAIWFGTHKYGESSILDSLILMLKIPMMVADLLIGFVIYKLAEKSKNRNKWLAWMYVLMPFSWYLSASWGQSDQLSFIFIILSFVTIWSGKYSLISPLLFALSVNIKPNGMVLAFLYLWTWYKLNGSWLKLIVGGVFAGAFSLWTFSWFSTGELWKFAVFILPEKIQTGGGIINYNAFNFWYVFYPFELKETILESRKFFWISAQAWGWGATLITQVLAIIMVNNKKLSSMYGAMFVAGFGSWIFLTGMHERYAFLSIVPLLIYSVYNPKYLKYFWLFSTVFTFNLLIAYWPWLGHEWIVELMKSNNFFIARILSAINVAGYVVVVKKMLNDNHFILSKP